MPDITVVVPTFNGSAYLESTLNSLALQRETSLEAIVVDDGSSDGSPEIAEAHPLGPRVIRQENRGVAAARNHGLAEARADWVAFLDQDDLWHVDRAATLLKVANETGAKAVGTTEKVFALSSDREALRRIGDGRERWPSQWVGSDAEVETMLRSEISEDGPVEAITAAQVLRAPAALTTAFMYDREALITSGGHPAFLCSVDDHFLNVCFTRLFGDVKRTRRPLLFYRVHPGSSRTTSPVIAPYLTTLLALRHGGMFPAEYVRSDFLTDLLLQLPRAPFSPIEQAALLILSTPPRERPRSLMRWAKRLLLSRERGTTIDEKF